MAKRAYIDTIRTLGFASISGAYAAVGTAFTVAPRIICITNNTAGDMYFTDNTSVDKLFVKAGTFKLFDLTANIVPEKDDSFVMAEGTIIYVKQITAPTSGAVYIELIYG